MAIFALAAALRIVAKHKNNIVKAPAQLKTLDDLMIAAGDYAEFCLRNSGRMASTLFLIGIEGPMMFLPPPLAGEEEKDNFANAARLMCLAYNVTASVIAMEAWLKTAKPGEQLDVNVLPSEAMDRQEVVALMGEERGGHRHQFLKILRSDNGRFFGFTDADVPETDRVAGRFAQILPPTVPDNAMQTLAKAIMAKSGKIIRLGNQTRMRKKNRDH